jgi:putative ABC transport system permease protein
MSYFETLTLALRNISGSKMRSFLTMLGIIIGVTAVIVIVGLGNGMENYMRESFASLGSNSLNVIINGRGSARSVSIDDMYEVVAKHSDVLEQISPVASVSGGIKTGNEAHRSTSVTGVSEDYLDMKDFHIAAGRGISYMDIEDRKHVCVIGDFVNDQYYEGHGLGDTVRIRGAKFTIVGILESETEDTYVGNTDDVVFMPYSTASRVNGYGTIYNYNITMHDESQAALAKQVIEDALFEIFADSDAYNVISMTEILDFMTTMLNVVITVLAIIAAISLLVGGVGIMNIMLVSVTERTREIGIRKALGAKESVIMRQFVMEAAVTSALGGTIGILLGYMLSSVATKIIQIALDPMLAVTPSWDSVLMAFGVSAGIGVLFGYLPARKAARLNPIDALRYE